eukprot:jgi/Botrbrau1/19108/Bobra.0077s0022.2
MGSTVDIASLLSQCKDKFKRRAILTSPGVISLLDLLTSPKVSDARKAAKVLRNLAEDADIQPELVEANAVPYLVQAFEASSDKWTKESILQTLNALFETQPAARTEFLNAGGLAVCLAMAEIGVLAEEISKTLSVLNGSDEGPGRKDAEFVDAAEGQVAEMSEKLLDVLGTGSNAAHGVVRGVIRAVDRTDAWKLVLKDTCWFSRFVDLVVSGRCDAVAASGICGDYDRHHPDFMGWPEAEPLFDVISDFLRVTHRRGEGLLMMYVASYTRTGQHLLVKKGLVLQISNLLRRKLGKMPSLLLAGSVWRLTACQQAREQLHKSGAILELIERLKTASGQQIRSYEAMAADRHYVEDCKYGLPEMDCKYLLPVLARAVSSLLNCPEMFPVLLSSRLPDLVMWLVKERQLPSFQEDALRLISIYVSRGVDGAYDMWRTLLQKGYLQHLSIAVQNGMQRPCSTVLFGKLHEVSEEDEPYVRIVMEELLANQELDLFKCSTLAWWLGYPGVFKIFRSVGGLAWMQQLLSERKLEAAALVLEEMLLHCDTIDVHNEMVKLGLWHEITDLLVLPEGQYIIIRISYGISGIADIHGPLKDSESLLHEFFRSPEIVHAFVKVACTELSALGYPEGPVLGTGLVDVLQIVLLYVCNARWTRMAIHRAPGACARLVSLLRSPLPAVRYAGRRAMSALSVSAEMRDPLRKLGALQVLLEAVQDREFLVKPIREFANAESVRIFPEGAGRNDWWAFQGVWCLTSEADGSPDLVTLEQVASGGSAPRDRFEDLENAVRDSSEPSLQEMAARACCNLAANLDLLAELLELGLGAGLAAAGADARTPEASRALERLLDVLLQHPRARDRILGSVTLEVLVDAVQHEFGTQAEAGRLAQGSQRAGVSQPEEGGLRREDAVRQEPETTVRAEVSQTEGRNLRRGDEVRQKAEATVRSEMSHAEEGDLRREDEVLQVSGAPVRAEVSQTEDGGLRRGDEVLDKAEAAYTSTGGSGKARTVDGQCVGGSQNTGAQSPQKWEALQLQEADACRSMADFNKQEVSDLKLSLSADAAQACEDSSIARALGPGEGPCPVEGGQGSESAARPFVDRLAREISAAIASGSSLDIQMGRVPVETAVKMLDDLQSCLASDPRKSVPQSVHDFLAGLALQFREQLSWGRQRSKKRRVCAMCGAEQTHELALTKCGRCMAVFYCGRHCQTAHWPSHRQTCAPSTSGESSVV